MHILNQFKKIVRGSNPIGIPSEQKSFAISCFRRSGLFDNVESSILDYLTGNFRYAHKKTGELSPDIDLQSALYIVAKGEVSIIINDKDGRNNIVERLTAGGCFGAWKTLGVGESSEIFSLDFSSDSELLVLDGEKFNDLLSLLPSLKDKLYKISKQRVLHGLNRTIGLMYVKGQLSEKFNEVDEETFNALPKKKAKSFEGTLYGHKLKVACYQKSDEKLLVSIRFDDSTAYCMTLYDFGAKSEFRYVNDELNMKQLILHGDVLVGLLAFGSPSSIRDFTNKILAETEINKDEIRNFRRTGEFDLSTNLNELKFKPEEHVCKCMEVSHEKIVACIKSGEKLVEDVSNETGAGTICGSCRPTIAEIIGISSWLSGTVTLFRRLNENISIFNVKAETEDQLSFKGGQNIVLQANINGSLVERSYSLISLPGETDFKVAIKHESGGKFTNWLFQQGDNEVAIRVSRPQGDYLMDGESARPALCFAAGIGITPIYSFIKFLEKNQTGRKLHLVYVSRDDTACVFKNELEEIVDKNKNISIDLLFTVKSGRPNSNHLQTIISKYDSPQIYICGPDSFIKSVKGAAIAKKIDDADVIVEEFK